MHKAKKHILLLAGALFLSGAALADDDLPIVEIKADRTFIYPQRMALTGEESLMDVLQLVPDLMIAGYEDLIASYNLRIDNCPMNGDTRLLLSQMKAMDIDRIQVCDNTGVQKGTIGMGKVLDINMKMPQKCKGFVEGQGDFGKEIAGLGSVNVLLGSRHTDLYANASYRYQAGNEEHLTLHMTNRFNDRNKLLTYFTQQYLDRNATAAQKIMGRARYFHSFNDLGTELLIVGGYQYASDPVFSKQLPLCIAELNTPLFTRRLSMTLGFEGDFLMTRQKDTARSWDVFNYDIYLQFTYSLPKWRFTIGSRVMFYDYRLMGGGTSQKYSDIRDNANACIVFVPGSRHQIQLGYYRKYYNPSHDAAFLNTATLSDEQWAVTRGQLEDRTINQIKLSYAYSRQKLTVHTHASYYIIEGADNFTELGASAYWKSKWVTLAGGPNLYIAQSGTYASIRFAPTAYLPHSWQIGMQVVYYTPDAPRRQATGVPVYGCLSVNKQFAGKWNVGLDWHDMFSNRQAANIHMQFRF